ncbi:MAG: hypothetical protein JW814_10440 [Candidatus Krumholzibacteriota bacterium]|nr:hypothetical protein [Candidatus Krumholzibacteriota bacterium]
MEKKAVILMPFKNNDNEMVYDYVIEPSLRECGYSVYKADEVCRTGDIAVEVISQIVDADLVIVETTEANPNVYYELGICHTLGKNTIPIARGLDRVPFYMKQQRILTYESKSKESHMALRREFLDWINEINSGCKVAGNPVELAEGSLPKLLGRVNEEMKRLQDQRRRSEAFNKFIANGPRYMEASDGVTDDIARLIVQSEPQVSGVTVAAVLGTSAIGKSRLSERLVNRIADLGSGKTVSVLGTDCYMLSRAEKLAKGVLGFDPESHRLDEMYEDIMTLIGGSAIEVCPYDHSIGDRGKVITIQPPNVIIVEGVHAFFHRLVPHTEGLRFFMHADEDTAKELKFLVDFLERGYELREAFSHADREYRSYERHTLALVGQANYIIEVKDYWDFVGPIPMSDWRVGRRSI